MSTAVASASPRRSWARAAAGLRRNRDFRLLWVGELTSELGSSVSAVAMPLLALALTGSPVLAGTLATISFVAMTLSAMPAGYIADRYDGRRVMIACDALRLAALAAVAIGVLLGVASIWLLFAVAAVVSVADMVFGPAVSRAVRAIVPCAEIPEAVAITEARSYGAEIVGPSAGGLLFALGRSVPFVFDAITFAISLSCTLRLRTSLRPDAPPEGALRFFPAVAAGWSHVRRDAFLLSSTLYSTVMNVAVSTLLFVLILGTGGTSQGAVAVGGALSLAAGAGMLGSLVAPVVQRRFGLRPVLVGVALARTLLVLAAALTGSTIALAVALASVVLLSPVIGAVMATARMLLVPQEIFGRVSGTTSFISSILQPAAPLLAGLMIAGLSQRSALLALVAAFAAVTAFAWAVPGLDTLRPDRDESR